MFRPSARLVVGGFAAARVAIGVYFSVAPARATSRPPGSGDDALMTRSFAVREAVLGVGGLLAVASARRRPSGVRLWAGLGALTDGGDLWAALAGLGAEGSTPLVPALVAAGGLACELWAFRAAAPEPTDGSRGPGRPGLGAAHPRSSADGGVGSELGATKRGP